MLPGIRFLCAAIVLTVSLVIFGLGAAALLRSAHEEFAAIPTRRAPPPTVFAQQTEDPPTLAMLRLEERTAETTLLPTAPVTPATPAAEQASLQPAPAQDTPVEIKVATAPEPVMTSAPLTPPPAAIAVAEPEKSTIVTNEAPQSTITVATAPATAVTPPPAPVADAVITGSISAVEGEAATLDIQPTATLTEADARLSSSRIATLGGPPVDTEPVPLPRMRPAAEPVKQAVKKRIIVKKRRVAVAPAPVQQTDPFGQPLAR